MNKTTKTAQNDESVFNLHYEVGKLIGKIEFLEDKVKRQEQVQEKVLENVQVLCKTIENLSNGVRALGDYCDRLDRRLESHDM